ncbi:hypothetical protein L1987_47618 [Smallanthus sonchifolius]|uniref:Uncharacterized protein n=1 Tax=Smallanthus sonchifolius TaxID=185202 RepID=A0ACB9G408_9ASTR|nr:hypothetical protein L1987_47618 [Smallanthus sonchifolius]
MWLSFPSELFLDYKREKLARRSKRDTLSEKAHEQNTKRVLKQLQASLSPRRSATSCGIIRLSTKMGDVAKDLASGTLRGVAQLVVGRPFDTIKLYKLVEANHF